MDPERRNIRIIRIEPGEQLPELEEGEKIVNIFEWPPSGATRVTIEKNGEGQEVKEIPTRKGPRIGYKGIS